MESTAAKAEPWTGRIEDDALLRGAGRFGDDVKPESALATCFVRSPHAFATIDRIDVTAAKNAPIWPRRITIRSRIHTRFPAAAARWRFRRTGRRSRKSG